MTSTERTAKDLARRFCEHLNEWLTTRQLAQAVELNRLEEDGNVCHSHDYCDANEAMAEAFLGVFEREVDPHADADSKLWAEAWAMAKDAEFDPLRCN